jgi:hypothetical protein
MRAWRFSPSPTPHPDATRRLGDSEDGHHRRRGPNGGGALAVCTLTGSCHINPHSPASICDFQRRENPSGRARTAWVARDSAWACAGAVDSGLSRALAEYVVPVQAADRSALRGRFGALGRDVYFLSFGSGDGMVAGPLHTDGPPEVLVRRSLITNSAATNIVVSPQRCGLRIVAFGSEMNTDCFDPQTLEFRGYVRLIPHTGYETWRGVALTERSILVRAQRPNSIDLLSVQGLDAGAVVSPPDGVLAEDRFNRTVMNWDTTHTAFYERGLISIVDDQGNITGTVATDGPSLLDGALWGDARGFLSYNPTRDARIFRHVCN